MEMQKIITSKKIGKHKCLPINSFLEMLCEQNSQKTTKPKHNNTKFSYIK